MPTAQSQWHQHEDEAELRNHAVPFVPAATRAGAVKNHFYSQPERHLRRFGWIPYRKLLEPYDTEPGGNNPASGARHPGQPALRTREDRRKFLATCERIHGSSSSVFVDGDPASIRQLDGCRAVRHAG
ncbi:MAG: hypothetical protein ACR2NN_04685 [Bryobacteraceae bacterium]